MRDFRPDGRAIRVFGDRTASSNTLFKYINVRRLFLFIEESIDEGTPQEMYVWPYFVRMSLSALTPQQKVELFRIVTGADYKDMMKLGVYAFYRLGIAPDGTWHFFVTGD